MCSGTHAGRSSSKPVSEYVGSDNAVQGAGNLGIVWFVYIWATVLRRKKGYLAIVPPRSESEDVLLFWA